MLACFTVSSPTAKIGDCLYILPMCLVPFHKLLKENIGFLVGTIMWNLSILIISPMIKQTLIHN